MYWTIEANYLTESRQTQSLARPLCANRATCFLTASTRWHCISSGSIAHPLAEYLLVGTAYSYTYNGRPIASRIGMICRTALFSMTLNHLYPQFQGHAILWRWMSQKRYDIHSFSAPNVMAIFGRELPTGSVEFSGGSDKFPTFE